MKALEIKNLHKSFKSNFLIEKYHILKGITLSTEAGEIYGFLGPNGAGKTTTIKCILGLIFPDSGEILVGGKKSGTIESRKKLGFLPEHPYFYDYLTPLELLTFTGRLFSIPKKELSERCSRLSELVGLKEKQNIKLRKFSKGMIQRVGLAQSLVHDPDLLILDEPFSGLDPIGRKELRDIIVSLKNDGKTIFFSSHILQDMELISDKVGIILNGEVKREGKLSELISLSVKSYETVCVGLEPKVLEENKLPFMLQDGNYIIQSAGSDEANKVIDIVSRANGKILSVTPAKMTLEDIFMKEINR